MEILEAKLTTMAEHEDVVLQVWGFGRCCFGARFAQVGSFLFLFLQTLYVIVNISTGNQRHKAAIIGCTHILFRILQFMVRRGFF